MEWAPGAIVPGVALFVGGVVLAIGSARSRRLRATSPTEPAERAGLALFMAGLGAALALVGIPTSGPVPGTAVTVWLVASLAGVAAARLRRIVLDRQAARASLELGTMPGPPRRPSLWLTGLLVFGGVYVPVTLPAALAASLFIEQYNVADSLSITLLAIGYGGGFAALIAGAVIGWRFLEHRGRVRAHAALEQGMARRVDDERHDAYRAGLRDGKADAAGYGRGGL